MYSELIYTSFTPYIVSVQLTFYEIFSFFCVYFVNVAVVMAVLFIILAVRMNELLNESHS